MPPISRSDGLPARAAGAWTKDKLYYVERYARAFMIAMGPKRRPGVWADLAYIDPLCGPGRCIIRDSDEETDGSPLLALGVAPRFDVLHFSDVSRRNVEALRKRIPADRVSSVRLRTGDCNTVVQEVVRDLSAKSLAVAFLDPEGLEVHFATLVALAKRRVDVLYLFPSGIGIKRNLGQFVRTAGERMDLFWGGPDWRQLPRARVAAGKVPSAAEIGVAATWVGAFRQKALDQLGLRSEQTAPMVTNDKNVPMYHLLFFSKAEAGLRIWRNIGRIGPTGQRSFAF